jgi:gas vesicle protein
MSKIRMGKLALGLVIGSVAGVGAALLAAPQSGEKTRGMLLEKGAEFENKATDTLKKGGVIAKDWAVSARNSTAQLGGAIRNRITGADHQPKEITAG